MQAARHQPNGYRSQDHLARCSATNNTARRGHVAFGVTTTNQAGSRTRSRAETRHAPRGPARSLGLSHPMEVAATRGRGLRPPVQQNQSHRRLDHFAVTSRSDSDYASDRNPGQWRTRGQKAINLPAPDRQTPTDAESGKTESSSSKARRTERHTGRRSGNHRKNHHHPPRATTGALELLIHRTA